MLRLVPLEQLLEAAVADVDAVLLGWRLVAAPGRLVLLHQLRGGGVGFVELDDQRLGALRRGVAALLALVDEAPRRVVELVVPRLQRGVPHAQRLRNAAHRDRRKVAVGPDVGQRGLGDGGALDAVVGAAGGALLQLTPQPPHDGLVHQRLLRRHAVHHRVQDGAHVRVVQEVPQQARRVVQLPLARLLELLQQRHLRLAAAAGRAAERPRAGARGVELEGDAAVALRCAGVVLGVGIAGAAPAGFGVDVDVGAAAAVIAANAPTRRVRRWGTGAHIASRGAAATTSISRRLPGVTNAANRVAASIACSGGCGVVLATG